MDDDWYQGVNICENSSFISQDNLLLLKFILTNKWVGARNYSKSIWVMNVEPPETLVIIESIVYKSNGFAIESENYVKSINFLSGGWRIIKISKY